MTATPLTLYLFQPEGRDHGLLAMLQKHLARDKRAMVMVDDAAVAKKIDDFLWDYSQEDFLAHDIIQHNDKDSEQPILIIPLDTNNEFAIRNDATAIFFMLDDFVNIAAILKNIKEMANNELQWIFLFCQNDKNHEAPMAKILAMAASDENSFSLIQWQQTTKGTWQN